MNPIILKGLIMYNRTVDVISCVYVCVIFIHNVGFTPRLSFRGSLYDKRITYVGVEQVIQNHGTGISML